MFAGMSIYSIIELTVKNYCYQNARIEELAGTNIPIKKQLILPIKDQD